MIAAVGVGLLALLAPAATGEGSKKKAPVPTADHVRVKIGGKEQSGWPLDPEAEGGYALLGDDGAIAVVALPAGTKPELLEQEARPVSDLPSATLVEGLGHAEEGVRDRCQELLLAQGDAAIPFLASAFDDASAESRRRALEIVVTRPTPKLLVKVDFALDDRDERVRQVALRAYAALKAPGLTSRCIAALTKDASVLVRHEAIVRLGRGGDVHAIDPLFKHLEKCDERSLRLVTFDALRRLTGVNLGRDEAQWRSWWTNHREELLGDEKPEEKQDEKPAEVH